MCFDREEQCRIRRPSDCRFKSIQTLSVDTFDGVAEFGRFVGPFFAPLLSVGRAVPHDAAALMEPGPTVGMQSLEILVGGDSSSVEFVIFSGQFVIGIDPGERAGACLRIWTGLVNDRDFVTIVDEIERGGETEDSCSDDENLHERAPSGERLRACGRLTASMMR